MQCLSHIGSVSKSKSSQSHVTTDDQSVSKSWFLHTLEPGFLFSGFSGVGVVRYRFKVGEI
jgi:hypothetical protein